jgi:hypothetical protein
LLYNDEVVVWGRRWIVKTSTLGERHGYGVYAYQDIIVEDSASSHREGLALFPYDGPIYKKRYWNRLLIQHPEWKTYALELDTFAGRGEVHIDKRVIDGDPIRSGDIVGFINNIIGTRPKHKANCEWVFVKGPALASYGHNYHEDHCLAIATRTIRSGDELFTHYAWS